MCYFLLYRKVMQLNINFLFHILFHYGLSQGIDYNSLALQWDLVFVHSLYNSSHPLAPNS